MGSMSVSSCRCCMFVSCVHPVAIFSAAFCMTCRVSYHSSLSVSIVIIMLNVNNYLLINMYIYI